MPLPLAVALLVVPEFGVLYGEVFTLGGEVIVDAALPGVVAPLVVGCAGAVCAPSGATDSAKPMRNSRANLDSRGEKK